MENRFTISENSNPNYLASICRITKKIPIEGSDFLSRTVMNGHDIVISNDMKIGEIAIYCPVDSVLSDLFLSKNNLYSINCYDMNSNADEVLELRTRIKVLTDEGGHDDEIKELEAKVKKMAGFFGKNGRTRIVKLRGVDSEGFVTSTESMVRYIPSLKDQDWDSLVDTQFDTVCGLEFIHKFINPALLAKGPSERRFGKTAAAKFDKVLPEHFEFHYYTSMLCENMRRFSPDSDVTVSVKIHGTSAIIANVLCRKKPGALRSFGMAIGLPIGYKTEYSNLYSTRRVIRNRCKRRFEENFNMYEPIDGADTAAGIVGKAYEWKKVGKDGTKVLTYGDLFRYMTIDRKLERLARRKAKKTVSRLYLEKKGSSIEESKGFYGVDVYGAANDVLKNYITEGMTLYGEIMGYCPGTTKMIQKNHDYGCKPGEWKFMPYRIKIENPDGTVIEKEVSEVYEWTVNLMKEHPETAKYLMPINILYQGRFGNILDYKGVHPEEGENWRDDMLAALKEDRGLLLMEEDEPLCTMHDEQEAKCRKELQAAIDAKMSKTDIKVLKKKLNEVLDMKAPREGVVVRINHDTVPEAFKLKTKRHYGKEDEQHAAGEFDMEEMA